MVTCNEKKTKYIVTSVQTHKADKSGGRMWEMALHYYKHVWSFPASRVFVSRKRKHHVIAPRARLFRFLRIPSEKVELVKITTNISVVRYTMCCNY